MPETISVIYKFLSPIDLDLGMMTQKKKTYNQVLRRLVFIFLILFIRIRVILFLYLIFKILRLALEIWHIQEFSGLFVTQHGNFDLSLQVFDLVLYVLTFFLLFDIFECLEMNEIFERIC